MNSRDAILAGLKKLDDASSKPPDFSFPVSVEGLQERFIAALQSVAGEAHRVPDISRLNAALVGRESYAKAEKVASLLPRVGSSNVDPSKLDDPHQLRDLDVAILEAQFGVAENGAVWLDANSLGKHRTIFVIAQHLILVLKADRIVPTMHEAYERIRFVPGEFGVFVSGPSKTADIEQTLVIGAHGARSCTLFLVG